MLVRSSRHAVTDPDTLGTTVEGKNGGGAKKKASVSQALKICLDSWSKGHLA